jgi:hypothetical protein
MSTAQVGPELVAGEAQLGGGWIGAASLVCQCKLSCLSASPPLVSPQPVSCAQPTLCMQIHCQYSLCLHPSPCGCRVLAAGLGRAPATALAYMWWFKGIHLEDAYELLTGKHRRCTSASAAASAAPPHSLARLCMLSANSSISSLISLLLARQLPQRFACPWGTVLVAAPGVQAK